MAKIPSTLLSNANIKNIAEIINDNKDVLKNPILSPIIPPNIPKAIPIIIMMIDETVLEKMKSTQFKRNFEPWNKGKRMSDAYREQCRGRALGIKQSASTKAKRSLKLKNHTVSNDARRRIAQARQKAIAVTQCDTGMTTYYDSISDFAKECGVSQSAICRPLRTGKVYRGKYIIKQVNPEGV